MLTAGVGDRTADVPIREPGLPPKRSTDSA